MVDALISALLGPASSSLAFKKIAHLDSHGMFDHILCAVREASIAALTSFSPAMCTLAITWLWSCGITCSTISPVNTSSPLIIHGISKISLSCLVSSAFNSALSELPGA